MRTCIVTTTTTVAMTGLLMTSVVARAAASAEHAVVLHVIDYAQVAGDELAVAERIATQVLHKAGVRAIWTGGAAAIAPSNSAFHADVVILSKDMVANKCQTEGILETAFGAAAESSRRAYIFYNRVADHAGRTRAPTSRLLGGLLAHEIGHLLLPAGSHSASGIMRADWGGRIMRVPGFTSAQALTIRTRLTTARPNRPAPTPLVSDRDRPDSARAGLPVESALARVEARRTPE